MSTKRELTGNIRYRLKHSWGKQLLVLQVEERVRGVVDDSGGGRVGSREVNYTAWRDGKVEDLPPDISYVVEPKL